MTEKNVLTGRARFDKDDAQVVVLFLQQEPTGNDHRGYDQHELAGMIVKKNKVHMALTEQCNANALNNKTSGWADLEAFVTKVSRLSAETGIKPEMEYYGGLIHAVLKWDRDATDMEQVAAKAFLRDHDEDNRRYKSKSKYNQILRDINTAFADPAPYDSTPSWEEASNSLSATAARVSASGAGRYNNQRGTWITLDEVVAAPQANQGDTNTNG